MVCVLRLEVELPRQAPRDLALLEIDQTLSISSAMPRDTVGPNASASANRILERLSNSQAPLYRVIQGSWCQRMWYSASEEA